MNRIHACIWPPLDLKICAESFSLDEIRWKLFFCQITKYIFKILPFNEFCYGD